MHINFPPIEDITFRLIAEQDQTSVRGNALASGDDDEDKRVEDEIIARLDDGDVWAWADVEVRAEWNGFEGSDYLGGCSYVDEADFCQPGGYFDDMKERAYEELCAAIGKAAKAIEPLLA